MMARIWGIIPSIGVVKFQLFGVSYFSLVKILPGITYPVKSASMLHSTELPDIHQLLNTCTEFISQPFRTLVKLSPKLPEMIWHWSAIIALLHASKWRIWGINWPCSHPCLYRLFPSHSCSMELFLQKMEETWPTPIDQAHQKTWPFSRWEIGEITRFGGMTSYSLMFGELMRIVVKLQQVKARSKHPSMIPEMIDWVIDWLTIDGTLQPSNLPWDLPVKPQGGRAFGPQTSPCGRPKRRAPQWDRGGAWTVTVNVGHETFVDRDREFILLICISGWWFGTWILWLSIYWEESSQLTHIFQTGWNQQPVLCIYYVLLCYIILCILRMIKNSSIWESVLTVPKNTNWQKIRWLIHLITQGVWPLPVWEQPRW